MKRKFLWLSILIFIFGVEAEARQIFLITKDDAKLFKKAKVDNDFLYLSAGNAYEIDNSFKNKSQIFIKLKLKDSTYTFVEKEKGVEKDFGSWPISKFEAPKPLTPQEQKAREEVQKKYDELMDQAWGGKERYPIQHENMQMPVATKEFICKESVRQAMELYYLNPSAFRVKATLETWQSEYEKCMSK